MNSLQQGEYVISGNGGHPRPEPATELMPPAAKCIGIAGLGAWGKNILRDLHRSGCLHTACDVDAATLAERSLQFPDVRITGSFDELLRTDGITAVVISGPAATHYACARKALEAGKDVFVEKPLALRVSEGEDLVRLAGKKGLVLMVGHLLQYHPAILKLRELVAAGELGKLRYIYSNRLNIGKIRTEENVLWSFAPHDISVILALVGSNPLRVRASGGRYVSQEVYDTTIMTLDFQEGVMAHVFVSWLHPYKEQKLAVVGSQAMAVFDDQSQEKLVLYPHQIDWKGGVIPVAHKADRRIVPLAAAEPLQKELSHFIDCITRRKNPRTDGGEGVRVLRVLEAAEKALHQPDASPAGAEEPSAAAAAPQATRPAGVHETAWLDERVTLGRDVKIWHFSHLLPGTIIGNRVVIGQNVTVGPDVTVGDGCKIQNNVSLYRGVTLEEDVFCGPSCVFTNVYNPRAFIERKHEFRETLVKKGATIGANATIVCGATVGRYAMVGAGAVVKHDVPDYAVVAGVPATIIGWACRCGVTLGIKSDGTAVCRSCNDRYQKTGNQLLPREEPE